MNTQPEKMIMGELNKTIQYSKQKVSAKLLEMIRSSKIDMSFDDASMLSQELALSLEQVYKDMAPGFQRIKEGIERSRRETKQK
jgi:hypothetical protein